MTRVKDIERPEQLQTNSQLPTFISRLTRGENLSCDDAANLLGCLLEETATDGQIAAALTALAVKGETVDELVGSAAAMRSRAVRVRARHESFLDTAGTGTSSAKTFNVSTAAAFVIAGAGVAVAKHGNRGVTSRTGSSDVLAALGVRVDATPETTEKCLNELGICFMFAPLYHGTTKRVAAIRRELGIRTIFNLLGPLTNPAGAPFQIVGVAQAGFVEPLARALSALGTKRAWVVHGLDGLDEVTLAEKTLVAEAYEGSVRTFELCPEDFEMKPASLAGLASIDAETSADLIRQILSGELRGVPRDLVIANASAALFVAGAADNLLDATQLAVASIDSGAAARKLNDLVSATNS
jgi:anthranilate phosphoribosyltransferase